MVRWRNTSRDTLERARGYSVMPPMCCLVEGRISRVWILLNSIVQIVEISILLQVANTLQSMVSPPPFQVDISLDEDILVLTCRGILRNHVRPSFLPNIPRTPLCPILRPLSTLSIRFPTHLALTLSYSRRRRNIDQSKPPRRPKTSNGQSLRS
jgi:hypothetical protein